MIKFHAILVDELGEEFSVSICSESENDCLEKLDNEYPESRVVVLSSSTY